MADTGDATPQVAAADTQQEETISAGPTAAKDPFLKDPNKKKRNKRKNKKKKGARERELLALLRQRVSEEEVRECGFVGVSCLTILVYLVDVCFCLCVHLFVFVVRSFSSFSLSFCSSRYGCGVCVCVCV
jgi:hypothetical protein